MTFVDKVKQQIWNFIYIFFLPVRKFLLQTGLIWHKPGRQRYHLGWIKAGKSLEEVKKHLHQTWHFGNNFIAWEDEDQVLSWRKLASFHHQYHLRIYSDGEIRGHYEHTPEAHPWRHFMEKGEEEKTEDFLKFLGEYVQQEKFVTDLKVDINALEYKSQLTIHDAQPIN